MVSDTILGVDFGTSGLKAVLLRADGSVAGQAEARYEVQHPRPGWSEADPVAWTKALEQVLNDLAARADPGTAISAVGIAGQMHAVVLVDAAAVAVRPAILWTDQRADLAPWRDLSPQLRAPLANPLAAGMTGPILTWLAAHEPEALDRAVAVVLPKDYVRAWLVTDPAFDGIGSRADTPTGNRTGAITSTVLVTDRSDAAGTLLWDVTADDWAVSVAAAVGIPRRLLPPVLPSGAVVGTTSRLSRWFPASGGSVPVVVGAGDTPAARLAVGSPPLQLNLGTGAQVLATAPRPTACADPVVHTYADADAGWYTMAAIQNAGLALNWVRRVLGMDWAELFDVAARVPDGARGVTFLPFLTGERGGVAAPTARGAWTGLAETSGREEMARAAVEGMVFAVRRGVGLLRSDGSGVRSGAAIGPAGESAGRAGSTERVGQAEARRSAAPGESIGRAKSTGRVGGAGSIGRAEPAGRVGPAAPDPAELVATGGGTRDALVRRLLADGLGLPVRRLDVRSATALGAAVLAGRGIGVAVVPAVGAGVVQEPRAAPTLEAAYERWEQAAASLS